MPPHPQRQLRQRAAAAADPPSEEADGASSAGASRSGSARANPGRQPYLPFSLEAPARAPSPVEPPAPAGSGLQQGLRRLAAGLIAGGASARAKKEEDADYAYRQAKKLTADEEAALDAPSSSSGGSSAPRLVPVLIEPQGGPPPSALPGANGFAPLAAGEEEQRPRRVAFETTVADDEGGTAPLRTESANERSGFVRGVGRVERWAAAGGGGWWVLGCQAGVSKGAQLRCCMGLRAALAWCVTPGARTPLPPGRDDMDSLKSYSAPWGYRLLERASPRGRGYSLAVRAGGRGGWGAGALGCSRVCSCWAFLFARQPATALRFPPAEGATRPARRFFEWPCPAPCPQLRQTNRMLVLALTFLCYTAYHASRKPPSIVKSVLHGDAGPGNAGGGGCGFRLRQAAVGAHGRGPTRSRTCSRRGARALAAWSQPATACIPPLPPPHLPQP